MPVCVGARAEGGLPGRGGGGGARHTMGRCLAHLLHARLDGFGRPRGGRGAAKKKGGGQASYPDTYGIK